MKEKGGLKLDTVQAARLKALTGKKGTRNGQGLFVHCANTKITRELLDKVKRMFENGAMNYQIQAETKLSEWIISGVKKGRYDYMEETEHGKQKETGRMD